MEVSDEELEEFRRTYKKEYGEKLSVDEAREMAQRLLVLMDLLIRPLPKERTGEMVWKRENEG